MKIIIYSIIAERINIKHAEFKVLNDELLNINNLLEEVIEISSHSVFCTLFRLVPFGLLIMDIKNNFIYSNDWLKENLNISINDLHKISSKDIFLNEIAKKIIESFTQKNEFDSDTNDIEVKNSENNIEWINIKVKNIISDKGKYLGKLGLIFDTTINHKIKTAHDESIMFLDNVKRLKHEFLANINHELRTPLNGIFGIIGLLKNTDITEQQKKYLDIIQDSSDSLLSTVNNILKFTASDSSDFELNNSQCSILIEMEQIVRKYSQRAKEKNIPIFTSYFWKNPKLVMADKFKFSKLIENILDNALKFTKNGYINVKIELITETKENATFLFSIKDTGIGIDKNNADKIFLPFSQLEDPYTKSYPGIGLGLSIANKIARKMGGKISLESEINNGSEFKITLTFPFPSHYEKKEKTIELFKEIEVSILINDDICFDYLKNQLEYWYMKVSRINFSDKLSFIKQLKKSNSKQLVLIDSSLLKDEIIDFLNTLHKPIQNQKIKCIFMASINERHLIKDLIDLGISSFIEKPFLPSNLIGTFKRALNEICNETSESYSNTNDKLLSISKETAQNSFKAKVLLVEDDIMNQRVAKEILEKLGTYVDVIGNGKEAILMSSKTAYDIIFMDLQIPEINGYATAQAIRTYERGYTYTPIIAYTGYLFEEDKKKSMEFGMDDILLKPVSFASFKEMLFKWTFQTLEFRNFPVFDYKKALDTIGSKDVLKQAACVFFEDIEKRFYELKDLVDLKNINDIEMHAHTLKSAAAYIGAERIRALSFYLENAANKKDNGIISALFYKLKPELNQFKKELQDFNWDNQ